ncbi:MAG: LysR family transcriptional regulator [Clostridia bacterium]|nr:LysR family transcriptional regulator [Clostridia bacterium]
MELLWLKYFCDAAQTENFSETARHYFVPPSNISQTIKKLEKELGIELFDRTKNKLTLSTGGRIYYEGVKRALDQLESTKAALSDSTGIISGELRLKVCTNRRIVTKAIEHFSELYPSVSFRIRHEGGQDSDFDIIITDTELDSDRFEKKLLINEKVGLALNRKNPLAEKENIEPCDLSSEHFITMHEGSSMYRLAKRICSQAGFEPNIAICTDDPLYIRKYIEMGLGISIFPIFSWKGQFSDGVMLKNIGDFHRKTYIYHPKNRYISRASSVFKELLFKMVENEL